MNISETISGQSMIKRSIPQISRSVRTDRLSRIITEYT